MDGTPPAGRQSIPGALRPRDPTGVLYVNRAGAEPPVRSDAMVHQQGQLGHGLYVGGSRYVVRKPHGYL